MSEPAQKEPWYVPIGREFRELWSGLISEARQRRLLLGVVLVGIILLASWMMPHDPMWVRAIIHAGGPDAKPIAKAFSFWGDFPAGTLGLSALIFLVGKKLKRVSFQRIALGCILAASLAGLGVNLVRNTAGRPRPMAKMEDGFYGPSLKYELHGFPSAHAATSMGTAATFILPAPHIGLPLVILAGGVSWSRMQLWRHHPTDVTVGSLAGLLAGLGIGIVVRRRNRLELGLGDPCQTESQDNDSVL